MLGRDPQFFYYMQEEGNLCAEIWNYLAINLYTEKWKYATK